ncbi:hypothetical protein E8E12_001871 [Didymella heteroderae]|uniref:Hydroxymethylglutaryl-CoA reductase (NADPH) n=1 Tax=Didymella heteroderae TaxID=1769908 RepID=A0A9P4WM34_9PLEO|nr:hypothetical protein E8E12_001871 [Didymella heteroderae]
MNEMTVVSKYMMAQSTSKWCHLISKAPEDFTMAFYHSEKPVNPLDTALLTIHNAYSSAESNTPSKVTIENHAGFIRVPVGIAGPLKITGSENTNDEFFAPLATVEATLVASCSRGCKAFNESGGLQFRVLREGMSRAPVFFFDSPVEAIAFADRVPALQDQFARDAESTSRFARLQTLTPHIVGSNVHLHFSYFTGDATGQNMVTIATQKACDRFLASDTAKELGARDFVIDGDMASDKKASMRNVVEARGCQVLAWGEAKLCKAVQDLDEKTPRREAPDVLPLYFATFFHHAAGISYLPSKQGHEETDHLFVQTCIRGGIDVETVTADFNAYNQFIAVFPLVLGKSPRSDGRWAVDMLLANNKDDPGMPSSVRKKGCVKVDGRKAEYRYTSSVPRDLGAALEETSASLSATWQTLY